jgi:ribonuclease T1
MNIRLISSRGCVRALAALLVFLSIAVPPAWSRGGEPAEGSAVALADLPREARATITVIRRGGPFAFERDGVVFGNYERLLPERSRGYYREYTVPTPGIGHRGARRIVAGKSGELYYSDDHYRTFRRIAE